ncbi:MAG: ferric reductase-like transmembrane domain-containing protein [Methanobacteriota archaeon]
MGEVYDATALCYGHHLAEGFRPFDMAPEVFQEVPAAATSTFNLTVVNPWKHELLDVVASINLSRTDAITFPGAQKPFHEEKQGTIVPAGLPGAAPVRLPFRVDPNATELVVFLDGDTGPAGVNDLDLIVRGPKGTRFNGTPDAPSDRLNGTGPAVDELVVVSGEPLVTEGEGAWEATVEFPGGSPPSAAYAVAIDVYYNASLIKERLFRGPDSLKPGESFTFELPMDVSNGTGSAAVLYKVKGNAYYNHADPTTPNFGNFTKWNTMQFTIGSVLRVGPPVAVQVIDLNDRIYRVWAQVTGFVAFFMLIPSLVLGGTFGLATVRAQNRLIGSARRRVLWHNSLSFFLLGATGLHMVLYLVENFYKWTFGFFWGGLALAAMLGLGLTGTFQNWMVKRWGYKTWRFTHLFLGVVVVVLSILHATLDGEDFIKVRNFFEAM